MSKIVERVVLQQVSPHLAPLLPATQFGFRPRRSVAAAIAYSHGSWAEARARGLVVAVAGFDLSSAFDTVDVGMVSNKLKWFGIEGKENAWISNYLSERQQQVQYNASRSTFRAVKYGVPQGSILGPLLFLVLVADLPAKILGSGLGPGTTGSSNSSRSSSNFGGPATTNNSPPGPSVEVGFSAYADDALCWVAGKDPVLVSSKLEELSSIFVDYASHNYLALNESKTQVLWTNKGCPIRVGSCMVAPADRIEVLGVSFDKLLTPAPHILSLISSARAMAAIARRLSLHLSEDLLRSVMAALYRGKIGYGCLVLRPRLRSSDPTSSTMAQLQVCVNNVARATIGYKKSDRLRVEELLSEASFVSVNRLVIYSIAMECWRALSLRDVPDGPLNPLGKLLSPTINVNDLSSPTRSRARTRAAQSGCLPPPTKFQVDSFTWWAYTCWNASPALRSATTMSAAKRAANELAASAPI